MGGAEMMLLKLISDNKNGDVEYKIISLFDYGKLQKKFNDLGINVYNLNLNYNYFNFIILLFRLNSYFKKYKPDIIQGWMYHGNFLATFCKLLFIRKSILIFNIRQSLYNLKFEKIITRFIIRINSFFSNLNLINKIIYNSNISKKQHHSIGFNINKSIVIGNGFDIEKFNINLNYRDNYRYKNKINDHFIIGNISRYHPMKGHDILIKSISIILNKHKNIHLYLYGKDVNIYNKKLTKQINDLNLNFNVHLMGSVDEVEKIIPAFDLSVISSKWGEGFSNFLGESMACGVPCISTNIGDSAYIIENNNFIVAANDADNLANAIFKYIQLNANEKKNISINLRTKIEENYSALKISKKYYNLYNNLLKVN